MSFKKGAFQISAQKISCQILLNRITYAKLFLEIRVRCEQCKPLQPQVINTRDSRVYDAEQHGDHNITSFSRSLICEMTFFRLYQLYSKYKTLLFCPLFLGTKNMCYYLVIYNCYFRFGRWIRDHADGCKIIKVGPCNEQAVLESDESKRCSSYTAVTKGRK